ncbi:HAMP domain-containing sensor histidine kinase [Actinoplanes sp. NPDC051411]|uniref:sensor histidine kinase n=1 Tax=Actinoplanes sp. NPDC051411 TaxID=3155522 RepID=UPI00341740E1
MHSLRGILLLSLGAGALVGLAGAGVLRLLRGRSIIVHIVALITITVAVVAAGVIAVAQAMFLSDHDLTVVLITVGVAALVSLVVGVTFGRRLAAAAMWARQAERDRRELVAWVSHDLRTPLAGLRAMSEALEDGVVADPEAVAEYHRRIGAETDRMSGLVDDLFELSRIHAGALHLHLTEVPLAEAVSDAIASVKPLAASKGIRIDASEQGWPVVTASEPELGRVIANLLVNSVRYTRAGGTVRVAAGHDRDAVWLTVSDSCGGIPADDLPRVFDVAFRGSRERTEGGGLGLAIVRGLVEAQGGRVSARNVDGGCCFEIRLRT